MVCFIARGAPIWASERGRNAISERKGRKTSNVDPQNMKKHPLPDKPKTQAQGRLLIAFLLEALERSQNAITTCMVFWET